MTDLERVVTVCEKVLEKHGTRNPFAIAAGEGIPVTCCPDFKKLQGMYKVILGQRFIFLNGNLNRRTARMVLAHELGHDFLHREMAQGSVVQDYFIMDMALKPEYQANLFAAHLLISSEKLADAVAGGADRDEAAALFHVTPELIDLKMRILEWENAQKYGENAVFSLAKEGEV
ncbi:MAG: ImmA/IrrE family metallo-endopeptidase [Clostridia bacterium]|nr:ImmA/IrrE family metallo-endopeptidase [Clostridia bacterium]